VDGAGIFAGSLEVVGQHDALALACLLQVLASQPVAQPFLRGWQHLIGCLAQQRVPECVLAQISGWP
jgi:hypothetical protein